MTNASNPYCTALGVPVPRIEDACSSPDANYYSLLLVALLERGAPLTLEEAALRFEEAGVAPALKALASLKQCKPARPPIYRDGDRYSLDPHDDEADLWAFRLGLRPARAVPLHVVRPDSGPPRTADQPLTVPELDEAWREGIPNSWSAQRIAAAVLVQGSCGISRPFGDERTLREDLGHGEMTKLRRRLEADAKSLFALYQYGRLHGSVRLRWGFIDEMLPAPWVHRDEPMLHDLMKQAYTRGVPLEIVAGNAPGWADPWSRVRRARVAADKWGWPSVLLDDEGYEVPRAEVQLARLPEVARATE